MNFERYGWPVHEDKKGNLEIANHSPAGENIVVHLGAGRYAEDLRDYYESFDVEEYAAMRLDDESDIRSLIDDAEAINDMLRELVIAIAEEMENET